MEESISSYNCGTFYDVTTWLKWSVRFPSRIKTSGSPILKLPCMLISMSREFVVSSSVARFDIPLAQLHASYPGKWLAQAPLF